MVLRKEGALGRVVRNLPDHGDLLANLVRWAAEGAIPLSVEGHGLLDFNLYAQPGRLILHVVNLTSSGTWRAPIDELIPVGPLQIRVKVQGEHAPRRLRTLVAGRTERLRVESGWVKFELRSVLDHEVVVLE